MNNSTTVYQLEVEHNSIVFTHSNVFTIFFSRAQSYLLSMDFLEIDKRQLWAFGFANGLVHLYSFTNGKFDNKNTGTKV